MPITTTARFAGVAGAVSLVLLAAAGCAASTESDADAAGAAAPAVSAVDPFAPEQSTVVGVNYRQTSVAPFAAAQDSGIAAEYGITLEPAWAESAPAAITQIVGGGGDVGTASLWGTINANLQGIELRVIGENFRDVEESLTLEALPDSGISTIEDLEGKKVGVVGLNSTHDLRLKYLMQDEGFDWESVEFLDVPFGEMGASLETGVIDAGVFLGPTLAAAKANLDTVTVLDYGAGLYEGFPSLQWVTTKKFADENPNTIAAFQCAVVVKGAELVTDDEEAYSSAISGALGWDAAAIAATKKVIYPASNDTEAMQIVPDIMYNFGVITEEFDIAGITIPLPDNCD
ncbi:ABC transporter substrate-binding protein [Microbacterium allomyrinae]|uniref:ABC transporter substrate-binding protein n=1 Tax=Microbacterium allomyrinae TaxID=2830666 RepID=A0A9X1LW74_9MICO|nr:ABC transporter substrate-binding protein [Microbacterium allomyrinae]MCC2033174.1 ABC transporter substrate-binding protein [Microbacterium allomyrinae]